MAKKKRLRTRRSRIMVVLAFLIVCGLAAFFIHRGLSDNASAAVTYTTGTVEKTTLTSSVSGVGNVELTATATVSPSASGEVSGLSVAVGDTVQEGQLLFTLVNPQLDLALAEAENAYDQAVLGEEKAELSVLQAKQSLSDLYDQYYSPSSSSTSSTATTTHPSSTISTLPPTSTTAPVTTTTESPTTTTESPTTTESASTTTVSIVDVFGTGSSGGAVLVRLATGTATGTSGSQSSTITYLDIKEAKQAITSAEYAVTAAENQVVSAELALQDAQENATAREVKAPISGTITALTIENGDTIGSSGGNSGNSQSTATSSSSVMTITNMDTFQATITLAEADVSLVEEGQKAVITFDALPDLTLTGKVSHVDLTGTNSQGVISYSVVVVPDTSNASVKGGMTVSVNIITEVATDVLAVPSSAVKSSTSGKYVQVLENDEPSDVTVEVGMSTDSCTEITSGLTEGQEIITATVTANSGTATTENQNSGLILEQGGMPSGGMPSGGGFITPGQ